MRERRQRRSLYFLDLSARLAKTGKQPPTLLAVAAIGLQRLVCNAAPTTVSSSAATVISGPIFRDTCEALMEVEQSFVQQRRLPLS